MAKKQFQPRPSSMVCITNWFASRPVKERSVNQIGTMLAVRKVELDSVNRLKSMRENEIGATSFTTLVESIFNLSNVVFMHNRELARNHPEFDPKECLSRTYAYMNVEYKGGGEKAEGVFGLLGVKDTGVKADQVDAARLEQMGRQIVTNLATIGFDQHADREGIYTGESLSPVGQKLAQERREAEREEAEKNIAYRNPVTSNAAAPRLAAGPAHSASLSISSDSDEDDDVQVVKASSVQNIDTDVAKSKKRAREAAAAEKDAIKKRNVVKGKEMVKESKVAAKYSSAEGSFGTASKNFNLVMQSAVEETKARNPGLAMYEMLHNPDMYKTPELAEKNLAMLKELGVSGGSDLDQLYENEFSTYTDQLRGDLKILPSSKFAKFLATCSTAAHTTASDPVAQQQQLLLQMQTQMVQQGNMLMNLLGGKGGSVNGAGVNGLSNNSNSNSSSSGGNQYADIMEFQ